MIIEDATVPISKIPDMVRRINEIREKYGVTIFLIAHAGDGNMHPLLSYDPDDTEGSGGVATSGTGGERDF